MTSKSSDFDFSTTTQDNITKEDEKMNEKLASLSFDQIDIDDSEFSIPPLENPPTLESILNAPDYDDEEFRDLTDQFKNDPLDSSSLSSQDSFAPYKSKVPLNLLHQKQQIESKSIHGSIFRHVLLKSISSQILSASNKLDAGQPTCLTVSTLIAVGMSRGLVLVFDNNQVLKWCLGSTAVGAQYGAVSALSFNIDYSRLLVGFARGQITMWNLHNGKILRTVTDAHPPGMAILHVRFTDDRTMAVSSDSGGSVFQLDFKRTLGVRTCESHCLFSGSKGEACVIEPLISNQNIGEHPMKDVILVAIGTLSKMLLVVLKPQLRLHYVHSFLGDPSTLPLLAWQYVIIQMSNDRVIDPVLAFARGNQINFAQVIGRGPDKIRIEMLQQFSVAYKLLAITWINSRTMVFIESSERAHLIDVRTEEELQVLDLTYVKLAYGTSFYKSLENGGNVSEAMSYAGSKACYNSIATYNHQLLLLGMEGVHVITLRSWNERINSLLKEHQYRQALQLGLSFYQGKGKGLVGLSWNEEKRKKAVNEVMVKSMTQYIDVFMMSYNLTPSNGLSSSLEEGEEVKCQLQVIQTCITFCLLTDNSDLLFNFLYDRFSQNEITKSLFLESLESFILEDKLKSISPVVMKDLVEHYETNQLIDKLQNCILHIDIAFLDFHQIVSICWKHRLYEALFYIYNKGMNDYTTPLQQLIKKLSNLQQENNGNKDQLGYKLLLYINCCLTGKAFPYGKLPSELADQVREQVLLCITSFNLPSSPSTMQPTPSLSSPSSSSPYPFLRTLIKFDTREFFNVFSIAFEEENFSMKSKQRLIDILLLLMLENSCFNPTQIGVLFLFLARQMSKSSLEVKASLFEQVLESLCSSDQDSRHEERQQIFIELLKEGVLERFHSGDREDLRLVSMAEAAEFYRVVEMLHLKNCRYHQVLPCYWKDNGRQNQVFKYLQKVMSDSSIATSEKNQLRKSVLDNIHHLVAIDSFQTARIVIGGACEGGVLKVIEKLNINPEILLKFFKGLFDYTSSMSEGLFLPRRSSITGDIVTFKPESMYYEKYMDLVCKFNHPQSQILDFLKQHLGFYIPEAMLSIVCSYKLKEVMCYLYEVSGNVEAAFDILMEFLIEGMEKEVEEEVYRNIQAVLKFLTQQNNILNTELTNIFWFKILDVILDKQVGINKNQKTPSLSSSEIGDNKECTIEDGFSNSNDKGLRIDFLKRMTSVVMTSAMRHLSLSSILERIISNPAYAKGHFGELKGLLMNMMDTCNYEKVLMVASRDSACKDLHDASLKLIKLSRKGKFFKSTLHCSLCFEPLFKICSFSSDLTNIADKPGPNIGSIFLFPCHHQYHFSCLVKLSLKKESLKDNKTLVDNCYLCFMKNRSKSSKVKNEKLDQVEIDKILSEHVLATTSSSETVSSFSLSPSQYVSYKKLREAQNSQSLMHILTELKSTPPLSSSPFKKNTYNQNSKSFYSVALNQNLAPPTPYLLNQ